MTGNGSTMLMGTVVIFQCLDHIIRLDASILAEVNHYRMKFLASNGTNDESSHQRSITKSNAVNRPKLTHRCLVSIQETSEVVNMIHSELEQGDPSSQLSVQLLSSIIETILDAVPKPSNRTFVL
jgi:hypothetical protein